MKNIENGVNRTFEVHERMGIMGRILVILASLLISGCGSSDEVTVSPNGDSSGTFYASAVLNRFDPGLNAERARGKELYLHYCVVCHGESGDGEGFNAYNLKTNFSVQPFDFTDPSGSAQATFAEIKTAIVDGGPAVKRSEYMPPWGATFSEYDSAGLADYVWYSLMKKERK
ncbi:MAG: c-type cytochrome [Desulfobacterales bacterium]